MLWTVNTLFTNLSEPSSQCFYKIIVLAVDVNYCINYVYCYAKCLFLLMSVTQPVVQCYKYIRHNTVC